jgi:hypothetical protein
MNTTKAIVLLTSLVAGALQSPLTLAHPCTDIVSLPITITTPGNYCLTQNLIYVGTAPIGQPESAIAVTADDVTIDFNGRTLMGNANAAANPNAAAVRAEDRKNVTVKNGSVRNMGLGVVLFDLTGGITPTGYLVEHMLIENAQSFGIMIGGSQPIARNNRIVNVTYTRTSANPAGIYATGVGATIVDNSIFNVSTTHILAMGIYLNASASIVQRNSISNITGRLNAQGITVGASSTGTQIKDNVVQTPLNTGTATAISGVSGTTNVLVDNNVLSGFYYAINLSGSTNSKYRNNTASGTGSANPYYGGINIGGNN